MEVNFTSAHTSGWRPLLDLQVRMREDKTVDWIFYKKSVSSPYFVLNRRAVANKVKRKMLAQEGIRRLRNTRPTLVEDRKVELMEDMAEMMKRSATLSTTGQGCCRLSSLATRDKWRPLRRGKDLYTAPASGVRRREGRESG